MSGPIYAVPITDVQVYMSDAIKRLQDAGAAGQMLQVALSISEYLKDAERWAYVRDYEIPTGMSAKETTTYVDQQLKEVNDDVERVVRARQRREDGVSGSSGTGDTANPIV